MLSISIDRAKNIIDNFKGKKIAVIGDVMLDRYFWGSVSRISPEAPVPVIDLEKESFHLGGAANVASNLKSLGIEPILCGVLGNDNSGKRFSGITEKAGIDPSGLFYDDTRPTTVKTRIIGNNQQLIRVDREIRASLSSRGEEYILNSIKDINGLSGIIFEDYNKGTITPGLINIIITYAGKNDIPVFVDPKFDNFFSFKDSTVFKPNKKEASEALGMKLYNNDDIEKAGQELLSQLNAGNILLTLGKDGMMLFESDGSISSVPTRARHVADVSGAGDTAIATLAAAYSGGASVKEAATLANYAAGVVCEEPGIVSIEESALLRSIRINHND
ncbi:MAG: D-glycero-beta-D-manno-heptose-7-phosphate kinase [Candidatus Kapaibacterium sp.]